eukprot:gene24860-biopygen14981
MAPQTCGSLCSGRDPALGTRGHDSPLSEPINTHWLHMFRPFRGAGNGGGMFFLYMGARTSGRLSVVVPGVRCPSPVCSARRLFPVFCPLFAPWFWPFTAAAAVSRSSVVSTLSNCRAVLICPTVKCCQTWRVCGVRVGCAAKCDHKMVVDNTLDSTIVSTLSTALGSMAILTLDPTALDTVKSSTTRRRCPSGSVTLPVNSQIFRQMSRYFARCMSRFSVTCPGVLVAPEWWRSGKVNSSFCQTVPQLGKPPLLHFPRAGSSDRGLQRRSESDAPSPPCSRCGAPQSLGGVTRTMAKH